MPLKWMISQPERFISVEAEDVALSRRARASGSRAHSPSDCFRQLFDLRPGSTEMSQADSISFVGALSALSFDRAVGTEGPLALEEGGDRPWSPRHGTDDVEVALPRVPRRPDRARDWITRQP
jgi:hypothetical protein